MEGARGLGLHPAWIKLKSFVYYIRILFNLDTICKYGGNAHHTISYNILSYNTLPHNKSTSFCFISFTTKLICPMHSMQFISHCVSFYAGGKESSCNYIV